MKTIDELTQRELKKALHDIADIFKIGKAARSADVILSNVKNSSDDLFCKYRTVIEFLEGQTFRLRKTASGYIFTRPGHKPDSSGESIMKTVENAINFEEEIEKW